MATEVTCIVDTGSGAGYHYSSLNAAIAGETGASPQIVSNKNLTTGDQQLTIKCRASGAGAADGSATVDGFTTDATRFIKIWTDPTEGYRHSGTAYPSGAIYRMESTNASTLSLNDNNIFVIGIAVKLTSSSTSASAIISGNNPTNISKCYVKGVLSGGVNSKGISSSSVMTVSNCVVCGFTGAGTTCAGILSSGTMNVYNCTIYGNYIGVNRPSAGTLTVKNCISCNNTNDWNGTLTTLNCASDDNDNGGTGDITIATHTDVFTDPANGDFSLKNYTGAGAVIDAGTDLSGSGVTDDIIDTARGATYDIGAFEYAAGGGGAINAAFGDDASLGMADIISGTQSFLAQMGDNLEN